MEFNIGLEYYTKIIEQNCEYKHENQKLYDQVSKLKEIILRRSFNEYQAKSSPKDRYNIKAYSFPIQNAVELVLSGLFTKEELLEYVKNQVAELGLDEEKEE